MPQQLLQEGRSWAAQDVANSQRLTLTFSQIFQLPARQAWLLARLSRGPERSVRRYVSTGPQRKRSQKPGSAGVLTAQDVANSQPGTGPTQQEGFVA